jgi:hypothetical protein
MGTRADPSNRNHFSESRGKLSKLLKARARQCLPLTPVPRLGLDRRPGSKACLLEGLLQVEMLVG